MDPTLPINYRPVQTAGKSSREQFTAVLEHKACTTLFSQVSRKMHLTETALLTVTNDKIMAADDSRRSLLVLLDLSSAFDTVDHSILLESVCQLMDISGSALDGFTFYLNVRAFQLSIFVRHSTFVMWCPSGSCFVVLLSVKGAVK